MCVFVKQKTAYDMRISDWSSDVCSADLIELAVDGGIHLGPHDAGPCMDAAHHRQRHAGVMHAHPLLDHAGMAAQVSSEERGVGTGCVSTCRSRWSPYH